MKNTADAVVAKWLSEETDTMRILTMATLMGLTNGLWKVSGEGSGGVTRAYGEDLWRLSIVGSTALGIEPKTDTTEDAISFLTNHLINNFQLADSIDCDLNGDTLNLKVNNCKFHHFTDYLEAKEVPRHIGCPVALVYAAMMEAVTGETFIIEEIDSADGNSQITLKSF
ncbi:hypothetical protein [Methanobacterium alcaliphilum]|uniref:hypothetical protein n=1 Tax=Methanobacterium alcaliphilum TaxID=392018 RepID=UPI00200B0D4C|nr:hypothetical protein [Methanobacterium alcaliphilum]MCK9151675.1 hypothetical protein [Methanobacterium alcaliphilum]